MAMVERPALDASAAAMAATVLLPHPPLPDATAMTAADFDAAAFMAWRDCKTSVGETAVEGPALCGTAVTPEASDTAPLAVGAAPSWGAIKPEPVGIDAGF